MGCGASTETEVDAAVHRNLHLDPAMRSQATLRAIPGTNTASPSRRSAHTRANFAEDGLSRASSRALSVATGRGKTVSRSATLAEREMRFFEDAERAMMEAELYSDGSTVADGEPGSTSLAIDRAKRILAARVSHGINGDPNQFDPEFFEDKAAVGRVREWFHINADAGMPLTYSPPQQATATPATPKHSGNSRSSALSAAERAMNTIVSPAGGAAVVTPVDKANLSPGYAPLPIPGNDVPMSLLPTAHDAPQAQPHHQPPNSRPNPAGPTTSPRTPVTTTTATNKYVTHDADHTATDEDLRRFSTGPQSVNLDASSDSLPRAVLGNSTNNNNNNNNNGDPYTHLSSSRRHRQHPEHQTSRNTPDEPPAADRGMAPTLANLSGIRGGSYSITRDPMDDGRDSTMSESSRSGFGDIDGYTSPGSTFRGGALVPRTVPKMPPFLTCYFGERNIQLRLIERMATGLRFPLQECTLAAHDRIIEATWERAQHPHRSDALR